MLKNQTNIFHWKHHIIVSKTIFFLKQLLKMLQNKPLISYISEALLLKLKTK